MNGAIRRLPRRGCRRLRPAGPWRAPTPQPVQKPGGGTIPAWGLGPTAEPCRGRHTRHDVRVWARHGCQRSGTVCATSPHGQLDVWLPHPSPWRSPGRWDLGCRSLTSAHGFPRQRSCAWRMRRRMADHLPARRLSCAGAQEGDHADRWRGGTWNIMCLTLQSEYDTIHSLGRESHPRAERIETRRPAHSRGDPRLEGLREAPATRRCPRACRLRQLVAAMGISASGHATGHRRGPARDHGRLASPGGSGRARDANAAHVSVR